MNNLQDTGHALSQIDQEFPHKKISFTAKGCDGNTKLIIKYRFPNFKRLTCFFIIFNSWIFCNLSHQLISYYIQLAQFISSQSEFICTGKLSRTKVILQTGWYQMYHMACISGFMWYRYQSTINVPTILVWTRTTRTPAFWGYPPPPHDYSHYWVILDLKSKK